MKTKSQSWTSCFFFCLCKSIIAATVGVGVSTEKAKIFLVFSMSQQLRLHRRHMHMIQLHNHSVVDWGSVRCTCCANAIVLRDDDRIYRFHVLWRRRRKITFIWPIIQLRSISLMPIRKWQLSLERESTPTWLNDLSSSVIIRSHCAIESNTHFSHSKQMIIISKWIYVSRVCLRVCPICR